MRSLLFIAVFLISTRAFGECKSEERKTGEIKETMEVTKVACPEDGKEITRIPATENLGPKKPAEMNQANQNLDRPNAFWKEPPPALKLPPHERISLGGFTLVPSQESPFEKWPPENTRPAANSKAH